MAKHGPASPGGRAACRRVDLLLPVLGVVAVGVVCVAGVLERAGEPALPLDDAFIHLQYARRLAEGHFYSYVPGEGYTTGATSWLWPLLVAPFAAAHLEGLRLVWVVWALGALAHVAVTVETARLTAGLVGRLGGVFAGAMCAAFSAFAWFAYSGMETVALAWWLARSARVTAEWCEAPNGSTARRIELCALGVLGPLLRPEGAVASLICALALWFGGRARSRGRPERARRALWVAPCLVAPALLPGLHWALAGHAASSTARVKWLLLDPHLGPAEVAATILGQVRFLITSLLAGGPWTASFLPAGFVLPLGLGLAAVGLCGSARVRRWLGLPSFEASTSTARLARPVFVWMIALGTLIPCTYATMLWNRVRYIWPFAPAWFVALSCLGVVLGKLLARRRPALGAVAPALLGAAVASLAAKLPWAMADLAQSSRAIARQQVALARWAAVLPADAVIGVNDTGAIAYLSGRRTFDVVGLTTESETGYWVAGAGSRFEHYERMERPLPSHFIVYPHWMACPPVLGRELERATVVEQSILGGPTMIAYQARDDLLGSGSVPFSTVRLATLVDELDVADLDSERRHGYRLLPARAIDNVAAMWPTPQGRVVADGGRLNRGTDDFELELPAGTGAALVMRVAAQVPLEVWLDGQLVGRAGDDIGRAGSWYHAPDAAQVVAAAGGATAGMHPWVERLVELPAPSGPAARHHVQVRAPAGHSFGSFHYWVFTTDL